MSPPKEVGSSDIRSKCSGCGAVLEHMEGPTHRYMKSSAACFARFNALLAFEYSDPSLQMTHRLTVDAYAVQHPGEGATRREIQSVGLHLARLGLQLEDLRPPKQGNEIMLGLGRFKSTLIYLVPPNSFSMTAADVSAFAGTAEHSDKVTTWARSAWNDWSQHHDYIRRWTREFLPR